jgi:nitrogen regulatory protein PII 1
VQYDELPKELLMLVVRKEDQDFAVQAIMRAAKTGEKGAYGDGKVFVSPVEGVYTVSSGQKETVV